MTTASPVSLRFPGVGPILWSFVGIVLLVGVVGFLTGLLLIPVGVGLAIWLRKARFKGSWAAPFGAAMALIPVMLDVGRVADCEKPGVIIGERGFDCARRIGEMQTRQPFLVWAWVLLVATGVCLYLMSSLPRRSVPGGNQREQTDSSDVW